MGGAGVSVPIPITNNYFEFSSTPVLCHAPKECLPNMGCRQAFSYRGGISDDEEPGTATAISFISNPNSSSFYLRMRGSQVQRSPEDSLCSGGEYSKPISGSVHNNNRVRMSGTGDGRVWTGHILWAKHSMVSRLGRSSNEYDSGRRNEGVHYLPYARPGSSTLYRGHEHFH